MNKKIDPVPEEKRSLFEDFVKNFVPNLIISLVVGGVVFAVVLLNGYVLDGTTAAKPLHWALAGGGWTFVGLFAFLQLPTWLFAYTIPVLMLGIFLFTSLDSNTADKYIKPEAPAVVQSGVTQPDVVPPVVLEPTQPAVPAIVQPAQPDVTAVQPETVPPVPVVEQQPSTPAVQPDVAPVVQSTEVPQ